MNKKTILMIIMIMFSALTFCQSENLPTKDLANLVKNKIKEIIEEADINFEKMEIGNINALNEIPNLFEGLFGNNSFEGGEIYQSFPKEIKKMYQYSIAFKEKNGDADDELVKEFLDFAKKNDFIKNTLTLYDIIVLVIAAIFLILLLFKELF